MALHSISSMNMYSNNFDEAESLEAKIEWSNLIFLPFHSVFKLLVLFSVIVKCILGPIQSVYPIVYCWDVMDRNAYLSFIKYSYWYCSDIIYGIDTFLHIVHRQVTDKAMRREYLPKSACFLLADIITLIPFFRLVVTDLCPPVQLWPNILAFTEFFIIYRIVEYFSLVTTHSFWKLVVGFTLLLGCTVNCVSCFWLLITKHGLCGNCRNGIYDWRNVVLHKLNETDEGYTTYVYSTVFILSFAVNKIIDETTPSTLVEFLVVSVLVILGHILAVFVLFPKIFAESVLRLRRICTYYPQIKRMVAETKRRNPSPNASVEVENFFSMMWKKRSGINHLPEVIIDLPRYLRVDLRNDLVWPVYYHSPILRKTSNALKRMICELIIPDYKLPGEKLYSGINSQSHLFYLKSGVVQILSVDDGITPILSVTSGTIFGDISFLVPPLKRKIVVRCLTYCEVLYLSRQDYLRSLHKYPDDRRIAIDMVKDRMKHARTLYNCKQHVRGLDRTEDEGIAWVKRRWWEISNTINNWKKKSKRDQKYVLPPEEAVYHCAKYIGQLVLCTDIQLQTKSLFVNTKFPWILLPYSIFGNIWHRVVIITVFLVLIVFPPNITTSRPVPTWFKLFEFWTDFVYAADICVSLHTAVSKRESSTTSFAAVMFARCKTLYFILDVLASIWTEYIVVIIGKPQLYHVVQFNRLIKIYMLFTGKAVLWDVKKNPMVTVCYKIVLLEFCCVYILGYVIYILVRFTPNMTMNYFFGEYSCEPDVPKNLCEPGRNHFMGVAIAWAIEILYPELLPLTLMDIYYQMTVEYIIFLVFMYCKTLFVAALYLKYREVANFQYFVTKLKNYYKYYKIHQDLLRRLNRYLNCHWKYYKGVDIMHPNVFKDEPYDIYWKVQGEVAEKIIGESQAFIGADSQLIRELAYASKFLILPKNATLLLFGVQIKNVSWIVQGNIKCEFHDEEGELLKYYYGPGSMLSVSSVFLNKASLRTYSACTECEILYIKVQDFFKIIKRYPDDWAYLEQCINEFGPIFDKLFQNYIKKHRDYQTKLRERIFHAQGSLIFSKKNGEAPKKLHSDLTSEVWEEPDSEFMKLWLIFRTIIVVVSIVSASFQGSCGISIRWILILIGSFCDSIAWMDIAIKLCLAYYDDRGLLITDRVWCVFHYLTRSFILDIIGALPWFETFRVVMRDQIDDDASSLINTICKFAHLYIIVGYFDYVADTPSVNAAFIMILKWQLVSILMMLGASHFLIYHCVNYTFDKRANLLHVESKNGCWLPKFLELKPEPTMEQLYILYAESLNLAQSGLMKMSFGRFHIDRENLSVGIVLFLLGVIYWFVMCYSLTLLVLNSRGNTLFQHGVSQLRKFLNAERVDKNLIEQVSAHFTYWWIRTKGINIHHLTNERIGVVLRQDLNYYFFQRTFTALDTLLLGGETLSRQLASSSTQIYVLPGQEIMRELSIVSHVYIVHRGKVIISQDGEKIATLTRGCIFGQLLSSANLPVHVSAVSEEYADLLQIPKKQFHELIDDEIRKNIAQNPHSKDDYMATKKHVAEKPYDTIQYILRGQKTIKLPFMSKPLKAHHGTWFSSWYSGWLTVAWLLAPMASVAVALTLMTLPPYFVPMMWPICILLDVIYFANFVTEFFTLELVIIGKECISRTQKWYRLKRWTVYVDAIALLLPILSYITNNWEYQLVCLLRLRLLYDFHYHFCRSFKSKAARVLLKFLIVILMVHAMSCGWIFIACRDDKFPLKVTPIFGPSNLSIDKDVWILPNERKGGCARITKSTDPISHQNIPGFVVPKYWQDDYIVSLTFIILLYTQTGISTVVAVSVKQIYYKLTLNFMIYVIDLWILSLGISFIYTKFRELYQYDYNVGNLITYLRHSDISPALLESVNEYTKQLWRRQRGTWLPELAQQAPMCLREDMLCALYMHHLETPPLFRQLPPYFLRQLAARLCRIVIFPGKCIVQEGDMFACIYFIHEGEVEKWYRDKNGESKMMSLLSTNGYFGMVPGLFPNVAFQFSYYTRTVVDFVFLRLRDWQDLLDGYPNVKQDLYSAAKFLKKDFGVAHHSSLVA